MNKDTENNIILLKPSALAKNPDGTRKIERSNTPKLQIQQSIQPPINPPKNLLSDNKEKSNPFTNTKDNNLKSQDKTKNSNLVGINLKNHTDKCNTDKCGTALLNTATPKKDAPKNSEEKWPPKKELEFMTNYKEFYESKGAAYVHENRIRAIKAHPTERWIIAGDDDGRLVRWNYDIKDNSTLNFVDYGQVHKHRIQSILFCGPYIITGSYDGVVVFYDFTEQKVVIKEIYNDSQYSTALTMLNDVFLVAIGNQLHQYPIQDNLLIESNNETKDNIKLLGNYVKTIWSPHKGNINSIRNHPKENFVVFTGSADGYLKQQNIDKKCVLHDFGMIHNNKGITTIALDLNANVIVSAGEDYTVVVNDIETGELKHKFGKVGNKWIMDIRISTCGRYLYAASLDGHFREFDLYEHVESKNYGKIAVNLWSIAISQDGNWLWSGTFGGRIIQWKIKQCS